MLPSPKRRDQPADTIPLHPLARSRRIPRTPPPRTFGELEQRLLELARANQEARNNAQDGDKGLYSLTVDVRGLKRVPTHQGLRGASIKVVHENTLSVEDLPQDHPLREHADDQGEFPLHASGYYVPPTRWIDPTDAIKAFKALQHSGTRCVLLGPPHVRIGDAARVIFGRSNARAYDAIDVILRRWITQGVAVRCGSDGVVLVQAIGTKGAPKLRG